MGIILKFLSGPLGLYALIAVAIALAGSLGVAAFEHQRAARYHGEARAASEEVQRLITLDQSKEETIGKLESALGIWRDSASQASAASAAAGDRAEQYKTQLHSALTRIQALSEVDRASPDCQKLLSMDLATVCPGTAQRVRAWSARSVQRAPGGSAGADTNPP